MRRAHSSLKAITRNQYGFTIVELLIVVVVIAILAAITIVSYNGITKSANNSGIQNTIAQAAKKIELYKTDSPTSSFPSTLAAAGVTLTTTSDTTYVYATSTDSKQYCLASAKAGRTYFISSTTNKPQAGICTGVTGTTGTGDVASDGPSTGLSSYSIFNGATPGTTQTIYNDGGNPLKVGNRFYTTTTGGITVKGLRVFNPASANSTFLNLGVTASAYVNDWSASSIHGSVTFGGSPIRTKTYTTPRIAGTWTDILFDTSFNLPKATTAAGENDMLSLVVQYSSGIHYVYVTPLIGGGTYTESSVKPGTYLAENYGLGRGINTDDLTITSAYYGIDILFDEI